MRLKFPTSLAPIPFCKGLSALQVRLTPKNREIHRILVNHPELAYASSRAHFRFIKRQSSLIKSYSFLNKCQFSPLKRLAFRPITANCQSDGFGLLVRKPRTPNPIGRTDPRDQRLSLVSISINSCCGIGKE